MIVLTMGVFYGENTKPYLGMIVYRLFLCFRFHGDGLPTKDWIACYMFTLHLVFVVVEPLKFTCTQTHTYTHTR